MRQGDRITLSRIHTYYMNVSNASNGQRHKSIFKVAGPLDEKIGNLHNGYEDYCH